MPDYPAAGSPQRFTLTHWLVVVLASIGFAFDIYELLMLPLIIGPATGELLTLRGLSADFVWTVGGIELLRLPWTGLMFFVPAIAGGVFGLLGGYLTDRFGRRFVLTWSILLYAFSAFAAGFSTSIEMLLFFRCTTFIGVCVEFVAAVAWLAELFPHPKQREKVLGWTQAFSSLGGLMIAGVNLLILYLVKTPGQELLPAIVLPDFMHSWWGTVEPAGQHAAWRYTLMSGLVPALPLILIRPFLPESPVWKRKRAEGTLKRPSLLELFQPALLKTTVVTTLMMALGYGIAFGAIQHAPRIAPGLPQVKAAIAQETANLEGQAKALKTRNIEQQTGSRVQLVQEIGGLTGRVVLAILAVIIVSRRSLIRIFQIPGLVIVPLVFGYAAVYDLSLLYVGIFLVGLLTVAQFSFWGNYLPRVYPLHLRGTGESFAANVGGRMIGTSFALVTTTLANQVFMVGDIPPHKLAYAAALVGSSVLFLGFLLSFWLPEPKAEALPE
jgi:MFS family permease